MILISEPAAGSTWPVAVVTVTVVVVTSVIVVVEAVTEVIKNPLTSVELNEPAPAVLTTTFQ